MANTNPVGWFEIPVIDMDRAVKFYEQLLNVKMTRMPMEGLDMSWFPSDMTRHGTSGALVQNEKFYKPAKESGALLYLSCDDVKLALDRAKENGAQVLIEKRQISPEHGFMGVLIDLEGNRIALHSNS